MTKNKTFKNLEKDLINTKKADRKKIVFDIIYEWWIEVRENFDEFKIAFLSDEMDKQFQEIKNRVGEFKDISKMSVLDFLGRIIIGYHNETDKFFKELHEEYLKRRIKFYDNYKPKK